MVCNPPFVFLPPKESFKRLLRRLDFKATVLQVIKDLPAFMAQMHTAIVSGGNTCLELTYIGVPGIVIPTIIYEEETARYLSNKNVFINLRGIKKRKKED